MSIEKTLEERGNRYGDFADHAKIAQNLQDVMRQTPSSMVGWVRLSATQKQALTVIADKIARILSGDPNYADNWHDIQGYAKLVEDRLPKLDAQPTDWPKDDARIDAIGQNGNDGEHYAAGCPSCGASINSWHRIDCPNRVVAG